MANGWIPRTPSVHPLQKARAFEDADLDTHLVRMVAVTDLAWLSGRTPGDIAAHGRRCVGDPNGGSGARGELDAVLEEAFLGPRCDHRPVFAAFYEDLMEELADRAGATWANQVRDRLGLYHLNSWGGTFPIPVFLFRYPLRDVPREKGVTGASRRPLVVPTVLDHRFSEAFCPSPQVMVACQLVDIGPVPAKQPAREVLHPFMPMKAQHLYRVGEVNRPVPSDLGPARREHLEWLRLLSGDATHATGTDGDLFVE